MQKIIYFHLSEDINFDVHLSEEENFDVWFHTFQDMRGKSKSSHDLTDDPKLSAIPAIESEGEEKTTNDEEEQAEEVITIFFLQIQFYIYSLCESIEQYLKEILLISFSVYLFQISGSKQISLWN